MITLLPSGSIRMQSKARQMMCTRESGFQINRGNFIAEMQDFYRETHMIFLASECSLKITKAAIIPG